MRVGVGIGIGLALAWSLACSPGSFVCQSDGQCVSSGVDGQCLEDGFCGFPDSDCPSGLRYGDGSGALSGQCAPEQTGGSTSTTSTTGGEPGSSSSGQAESSTGPAIDDSATETSGTTSASADTGPASTTTSGGSTGDSGSSSTGEPLDPSLVLWLKLDDVVEDGMWLDSSGYDHHGVCTNCPELADGIDGFAARFDGDSTFIEVPHSDLLATPTGFTIAAWIYLEQPPEGQRSVVTKRVGEEEFNSWELYFFTGGVECPDCLIYSMAADTGDDTLVSPDSLAVQQWVHVAGTWDGDAMGIWVDGQLSDERPVNELFMDNNRIIVGADDDQDPADPEGLIGYFDGLIDDVRLYDRRLDEEELAALATSRP